MTLYLLKVQLQTFSFYTNNSKIAKILSCDTLVANERYVKQYAVLNFCVLTLGQLKLSLPMSGFHIDKPITTHSSGVAGGTASTENISGGKPSYV